MASYLCLGLGSSAAPAGPALALRLRRHLPVSKSKHSTFIGGLCTSLSVTLSIDFSTPSFSCSMKSAQEFRDFSGTEALRT